MNYYSTSLEFASFFKLQHKEVIKKIKTIAEEDFDNTEELDEHFQRLDYISATGTKHEYWLISIEAIQLVLSTFKKYSIKVTKDIMKGTICQNYGLQKSNGAYIKAYVSNFELPQVIKERKNSSRFVKKQTKKYDDLIVSMDIEQELKIALMIKTNYKNGINYKESYKLIKKEILGE